MAREFFRDQKQLGICLLPCQLASVNFVPRHPFVVPEWKHHVKQFTLFKGRDHILNQRLLDLAVSGKKPMHIPHLHHL